MYNNVSVFSLNRSFSDHSPLCLNSGDVHRPNKDFRYELCWSLRPNFRHMVIDNWDMRVTNKNSFDVWKEKVKRLKNAQGLAS